MTSKVLFLNDFHEQRSIHASLRMRSTVDAPPFVITMVDQRQPCGQLKTQRLQVNNQVDNLKTIFYPLLANEYKL